MVPKPFWERQWSCHLNEREKEETISTMRRDGQVRWPKVIVKYSGLKSDVPAYSPEPQAAREQSHATARACGPGVVHPDKKEFGCSSLRSCKRNPAGGVTVLSPTCRLRATQDRRSELTAIELCVSCAYQPGPNAGAAVGNQPEAVGLRLTCVLGEGPVSRRALEATQELNTSAAPLICANFCVDHD